MTRRSILAALGSMMTTRLRFPSSTATNWTPEAAPSSYALNTNVLPAWNLTGTFSGMPVIVRANAAYAGCIYSLQWGPYEFVNPQGHGGQIQTATFLDDFTGSGADNPTEAGSMADLNGPHSTSQVLYASNAGNVLRTVIHPAYWTPLGGQLVSPDTFAKTVFLGFNGLPNVLQHYINVITAQPHQSYSPVILTGYHNFAMSNFWQYDPVAKAIHQVPIPAQMPPPSTLLRMANVQVPVIVASPDQQMAACGYWRKSSGQVTSYAYGYGGTYPQWAILGQNFSNTPANFQQGYEAFTVFGNLPLVKDTLDQLFTMAP